MLGPLGGINIAMLVELNAAELYQRGSFTPGLAAPFRETAEILDGLALDLHLLQREFHALSDGLQAADPEDNSLSLANAVRIEGLSQARSLIRRAHLVLERTSSDARLAERRTTRNGAPAPAAISVSSASANPPRANGAPPTRRVNPSGAVLGLAALPPDGEFQRYRVEGPLTFAAMLALKQAIARLPGVRSVRVAPRPEGTTQLTLVSDDPERTLQDLQRVPGFWMTLVPA